MKLKANTEKLIERLKVLNQLHTSLNAKISNLLIVISVLTTISGVLLGSSFSQNLTYPYLLKVALVVNAIALVHFIILSIQFLYGKKANTIYNYFYDDKKIKYDDEKPLAEKKEFQGIKILIADSKKIYRIKYIMFTIGLLLPISSILLILIAIF